jgi:hypothetical protein
MLDFMRSKLAALEGRLEETGRARAGLEAGAARLEAEEAVLRAELEALPPGEEPQDREVFPARDIRLRVRPGDQAGPRGVRRASQVKEVNVVENACKIQEAHEAMIPVEEKTKADEVVKNVANFAVKTMAKGSPEKTKESSQNRTEASKPMAQDPHAKAEGTQAKVEVAGAIKGEDASLNRAKAAEPPQTKAEEEEDEVEGLRVAVGRGKGAILDCGSDSE